MRPSASTKPRHTVPPPRSLAELLERVRSIAGGRLEDITGDVPPDLRRAKGFIGHAVERALGADAGTRDEPDFPDLGVELKTIPVGGDLMPKEVTYVCRVSFRDTDQETWATSRVHRKLSTVLFVPVEAEANIPLGKRRIGGACLFRLQGEWDERLRADWEELAGRLGTGEAASLTSRIGTYLHVRPKAASSRVRALAPGADGGSMLANPRGYYLRKCFTKRVLEEASFRP